MIRRDRIAGPHRALRSSELLGKTLGIVGVGQIGGRLIELCAPFAMDVLAYDPYLTDDEATARGAARSSSTSCSLAPTSCSSTAR